MIYIILTSVQLRICIMFVLCERWSSITVALAILLDCEVLVYRENSFRTVVSDECGRGIAGHWNHYDGFIEFVVVSQSVFIPMLPDFNWWSTVLFNSRVYIVLNARPDGNYMSSAVVHQLFGLDVSSPARSVDASLLRNQAVDYFRSHCHVPRIRDLVSFRTVSL